PGRYDPKYEAGNDYPAGHVRWTAQRNFEAVLQMMAEKRLQVEPLITHREMIANAAAAYDALMSGSDALGILLEYEESPRRQALIRIRKAATTGEGNTSVAVIGAGSFSRKVI